MELSLFHSFLKCPKVCPGQRGGSRRRELAEKKEGLRKALWGTKNEFHA